METILSKFGHLLKTSKLATIIEMLIVFAPGFIILNIITGMENSPVMKMITIWIANMTMLLLVWSGIKLRGQSLSDYGITFGPVRRKEIFRTLGRSLIVCILAGAAYVLGSMIMMNYSGTPEAADMSNYNYLQNNLFLFLLTLFGVYIVSSFGEEVIYRAFLINRFTDLGLDGKQGRILAVVLSAVIFGLVHFEWGLTGIVSTGFMGLVMGLFYLKFNRNIWILVLAHAYLDTLLLVPLFLGNS